MMQKGCKAIIFGGLLLVSTMIQAVLPLSKNLDNLLSQSGTQSFKHSVNANALKLLSHFTTQDTQTYCGIASAVMVLNASGITPPHDTQHSPHHYFTQENFFNDSVKKIIAIEHVKKSGLTLTQLKQVINTHGLLASVVHANETNLKQFRNTLHTALSQEQFVIVNFFRPRLQMQGAGHHSPVAAYDSKTDRFLILDVARYKYPAYWVSTHDLWEAVNTNDGDQYRGFLVISVMPF